MSVYPKTCIAYMYIPVDVIEYSCCRIIRECSYTYPRCVYRLMPRCDDKWSVFSIATRLATYTSAGCNRELLGNCICRSCLCTHRNNVAMLPSVAGDSLLYYEIIFAQVAGSTVGSGDEVDSHAGLHSMGHGKPV